MKYNLDLAYQAEKLLVPTPVPITVSLPLPQSIFTSFNDAPGGYIEELAELQHSVGMEHSLSFD